MTTDKVLAIVFVSLCLAAAVLVFPSTARARCGDKRVCRNRTAGVVRPEDVARYAHDAGFRRENLLVAIAVAGAESDGFRFKVECDNIDPDRSEPDGSPYVCSTDYGLWQANNDPDNWFPSCSFSKEAVLDPMQAAKYAHCISDGGSRWSLYNAYKDGSWREYWKVAREAVARLYSERSGTITRRQPSRRPIRPVASAQISKSFVPSTPAAWLGRVAP